MDTSQVDKNFKTENTKTERFSFYNYSELTVEGFPFMKENGNLNRLPDTLINQLPEPLMKISRISTGGVVRFRTDSRRIAVRCKNKDVYYSAIRAIAAGLGFDLYSGKRFISNYRPNTGAEHTDMEAEALGGGMHDYSLYMPIYSGIEELEIGILKGCRMEKPTPHRISEPIVFYGSSVTHGSCASRPGRTYPAIVTRMLDAHMINMGFSGNALGETEIAELIGKTEASAIVLEYDHNAQTVEYLEKTHGRFFEIIRRCHPRTPVVMMSRPHFNAEWEEDAALRRNVVRETYLNALKSGDKAVRFIDGMSIFPAETAADCSIDLIHPNDIGFDIMAKRVLCELESCSER